MKKILSIMALLALNGCAANSEFVKTIVLPTSNKSIDVVQHRSSVEFGDCGTLVVLQTYASDGALIDSKEARGEALHCGAILQSIQNGGMVGAAHALRPSRTNIDNDNHSANSAAQSQGQSQSQEQTAASASVSAANAASASTSSATGGNGGTIHWTPKAKPAPKPEKPKGNNGYGNGGHDGSPNGKQDHNR